MQYYKMMFGGGPKRQNGIMARPRIEVEDEYILYDSVMINDWDNAMAFEYDPKEGHVATEYLGNVYGWSIFSEKAIKLFGDLITDDVQLLPIKVINKDTGVETDKYFVVNVLSLVDALDLENSVYTYFGDGEEKRLSVMRYGIDGEKAAGHNIFRLEGSPFSVFVSDKFYKTYKKNKMYGCSFSKIRTREQTMQKTFYIAKELCLPSKDINDIKEYLQHNEWGIAFEILCCAVEQENIAVNKAQYKEIVSIGKSMKMDSELWERIRICSIPKTEGMFTDPRDGKAYKTVKIGDQTWMAENLNYDAEGSECYDNDTANSEKYGRLYDWETAVAACPDGWRLPTNEEWQKLVDFAGGDGVAGGKLKAESGWAYSDNGTDDYGFSALPGGSGGFGGDNDFRGAGQYGHWWSAAEGNGKKGKSLAYYWRMSSNMGYRNSTVFKLCCHKAFLNSVRCIEN